MHRDGGRLEGRSRSRPTETCARGGGGAGRNLLANPGFESGRHVLDRSHRRDHEPTTARPHAGSYYAWLDGYGTTHTDTVSQIVTIPAATTATLSFYLDVATDETSGGAYDKLTLTVEDDAGWHGPRRRTPTWTTPRATTR